VSFGIPNFTLGAEIDATFPGGKTHEIVPRISRCGLDKKGESLIHHKQLVAGTIKLDRTLSLPGPNRTDNASHGAVDNNGRKFCSHCFPQLERVVSGYQLDAHTRSICKFVDFFEMSISGSSNGWVAIGAQFRVLCKYVPTKDQCQDGDQAREGPPARRHPAATSVIISTVDQHDANGSGCPSLRQRICDKQSVSRSAHPSQGWKIENRMPHGEGISGGRLLP